MIQRIVKDACILLAAALYGIMMFLQLPKAVLAMEGKCFTVSSSQDFQQVYQGLPQLRAAEFTTLTYDNIFLWVFGIFLISYILTLKSINADEKRNRNVRPGDRKKINLMLNVLLLIAVGYIISDWWENHLYCEIMSRSDVTVTGLPLLANLKWLMSLGTLIGGLAIDKKYFRNNFNIFYRIIMVIGIMVTVMLVLAIQPFFSGLFAKMDAVRCYAMSTLFD
ncbi:hypothetical protein [uncultured Chryseobacterium sp.]|uniref:hypothetical protein n=1 Tax=uncultured Chryseobacterium sp. TaxID=259322 RepID=UPI0025F5EF5C|nr:hypothetical protein [uncultured Chryseobacterium sp.]